jgi:hypothetical protein
MSVQLLFNPFQNLLDVLKKLLDFRRISFEIQKYINSISNLFVCLITHNATSFVKDFHDRTILASEVAGLVSTNPTANPEPTLEIQRVDSLSGGDAR